MSKTWETLRKETATFKDKLGMPMDEEIIDLVASLRLHRFTTVMSCAGHTDRFTGGPYVIMTNPQSTELCTKKDNLESRRIARKLTANTAHRLYKLIESFYEERSVSYGRQISIQTMGDDAFKISCIGGSVCITQENLSDSDRNNILSDYRNEMLLFSEFLKMQLKTP